MSKIKFYNENTSHSFNPIPPPLHPLLFLDSPSLEHLKIVDSSYSQSQSDTNAPQLKKPNHFQMNRDLELESSIASTDDKIRRTKILEMRRMKRSTSMNLDLSHSETQSETSSMLDDSSSIKFDYSHQKQNDTFSESDWGSDTSSMLDSYPEWYDGMSSDRDSQSISYQNIQNFDPVIGNSIKSSEYPPSTDDIAIDLTSELDMDLISEGIITNELTQDTGSLLIQSNEHSNEYSNEHSIESSKNLFKDEPNIEEKSKDLLHPLSKILSLPNEILWKIYLYLNGSFLAKLALVSKSHYISINYPNYYPTQPNTLSHNFWTYISQMHFKSKLIRRYKYPCEVHPKLFYLVQSSKFIETLIKVINQACSNIELRTKLHHRDEVVDVCLFSPYLFWLYRQTYKFELHFQGRDMRQHPLYFYYMSLPGSNNSLKYYEKHEEYIQFYLSSMTLLAIPKRNSDGKPIKEYDQMRLKRHMRGIMKNWLNEWINESSYNYSQSIVSVVKQFSKKKIKIKFLELKNLSNYRQVNGTINRMKIYVDYCRNRLK